MPPPVASGLPLAPPRPAPAAAFRPYERRPPVARVLPPSRDVSVVFSIAGAPAAEAAGVLGGRLRVTPAEGGRPEAPLALLRPDEHRRLIAMRANAGVPKDGSEAMQAPFRVQPVAKARLPDAALWAGAMVYVTDEAGGATLAQSDGVNWRRLYDNAVVS